MLPQMQRDEKNIRRSISVLLCQTNLSPGSNVPSRQLYKMHVLLRDFNLCTSDVPAAGLPARRADNSRQWLLSDLPRPQTLQLLRHQKSSPRAVGRWSMCDLRV